MKVVLYTTLFLSALHSLGTKSSEGNDESPQPAAVFDAI